MKILRICLLTTIGSYGFAWTVIEVSSYFGWEPFKDIGTSGHLWLISISLYIGLAVAVLYHYIHKKRVDVPVPPRLDLVAEALLDQIKTMKATGHYHQAVIFGVALSRPLWISGEYKTRIEIGKIVADAALMSNDRRVRAVALIDDIGWTYVALEKFDDAEMNVRHGIEVASRVDDFYLVAKGKRHLAGIAIEKRRFDEAICFLDDALKETERIQDKRDKQVMIAGIEYGFSLAYLMEDELKKAESYCLRAKEKYENMGDQDRIPKIHAQLGVIAERSGNLAIAMDHYKLGLQFAEQVNRKDEMVRNHIGSAATLLQEGRIEEAEKHLRIAKKLSKSLYIPGMIDKHRKLLKGS